MLTVMFVLVLVAFGTAVAAAIQKCPLWIPVVFLCIIEMLRVLPHG